MKFMMIFLLSDELRRYNTQPFKDLLDHTRNCSNSGLAMMKDRMASFSASFMTLINGDDRDDCIAMCGEAESGSVMQNRRSQSEACSRARKLLECFKNACGIEVASSIPYLEDMMRNEGVSCDLSGSSALSGSLLVVLVALLITAYRALV